MHVSAHIVDEISIHALRKESDSIQHGDYSDEFDISIHALRKESDAGASGRFPECRNFNPRSP